MSVLAAIYRKGFALLAGLGDRKRDRDLREADGLIVYRSLPYSTHGEEGLTDLYLPDTGAEKYPVLISVHGGGFCYGDKERYRFYCMDLAKQGFAVVNFNYRLFPARYPAPIEDLDGVVRFVLQNAQKYRLDGARIFAVGDSAGATTLALYAAAQYNAPLKKALGIPMSEVKFRAIGLHSGIFPLRAADWRRQAVLWDWLGKTKEEREKNAKTALLSDCASFPPTFFSYSVNDSITQDTPLFYEELIKNGSAECELCAYGQTDKRTGHVFHLDVRSTHARDCGEKQMRFFKKYMGEN